MTILIVIGIYLGLLIALGVVNKFYFRGTSADYFVASRSIGPFMLLMSVFGTTMTGFALVGSTGEAYRAGIGVYGLMASWSGLVHSLIFFLVGIKLWAYGKRYGYMTQIGFFRDRFESNGLGWILFPILVGLVIPYLLVGVIGAGKTVQGVTAGLFPEAFPLPPITLPTGALKPHPLSGSIPLWLTGLVVCGVVLFYVFIGGVRGAAWANTFQTLVFMFLGMIAVYLISDKLGGPVAASEAVLKAKPERLSREEFGQLHFLSYCFVPLSVGMFPHLFQHWLTAKSAKAFRLTVIAHPIFIMIVWLPCILIGIWATAVPDLHAPGPNAVLGKMVGKLVHSELLSGLITAGVLAAIMSSLDSQFVCIGSMFTNDVVAHHFGKERFSDSQKLWMGRGFVVLIVAATYLISLIDQPQVFKLGVWCFSGFAALTPLVFAALYWRRATRAGAIASVLMMVAVWVVLFYRDMSAVHAPGEEDEKLILGMMPVVFIFAASAVTMVVVSLCTQPPSAATIEKFFPGGKAVGAVPADASPAATS